MKNTLSFHWLAIATGFVLACMAAGRTNAGVTFLQADTNATTSSYADINGGTDEVPVPPKSAPDDPVKYTTLPNGTTHSNASVVTDPPHGQGTNSELATPDFSSASAGVFTFVGSSSGSIDAGATGTAGGAGLESADYEFTVDTKSNLEVLYSAKSTGKNKDYFESLSGPSGVPIR